MTVLESYIVKQTNKIAEEAGYLHRKVMYQNRNGAPDDWYFGQDGHLIIIEHKKPGEVPQPHQQREIDRLRARGFNVYVVDDPAKARAIFARNFQRGSDLA
jgi:hypothetical protein